MKEKPDAKSSLGNVELDKAEKQFEKMENDIKELTQDRMSDAPKLDVEPQTKIANSDIDKKNDLYLKPIKTIGCKEQFNEKYRNEYEFQKQFVNFTCENLEIIGDGVELWTRPFPGVAAQFWKVPVNKPLWGPRYLAEQLRKCSYHRLIMQEQTTNIEGDMQYYGKMVADKTVDRITAHPVSSKRSVFMGTDNFN